MGGGRQARAGEEEAMKVALAAVVVVRVVVWCGCFVILLLLCGGGDGDCDVVGYSEGDGLVGVDIAGPGFINLRVTPILWAQQITDIFNSG